MRKRPAWWNASATSRRKLRHAFGALGMRMNERGKAVDALDVGGGPVGDWLGHVGAGRRGGRASLVAQRPGWNRLER